MIDLWPALIAHQGESFYTTGRGTKPGVSFTYRITGGEKHVSRKEKAITRSTLFLAYQRAAALDENVPGPKSLGVFGASYIFPVFIAIGIITVPVKKKEEPAMPRPKGSKNKALPTIDERIAALEADLATLRETVAAKEAELAQLKETRDKELIGKLMDAIAESGKSVQDVIDMVKTEKTHATGAERTENS